MYKLFPLLVIPIIIYNVMAFVLPFGAESAAECSELVGRTVHPLTCSLDSMLLQIPMASIVSGPIDDGARIYWAIHVGDALLCISLVFLFLELLKSTGVESDSITNHALSLVVFVIGLIQFLLLPAFATSTFFFITLMALLDVMAGFIVTLSAARRDVSLTS